MTIAQPTTDDKHYLPRCPVLARLVEDAKTAYPGKADSDRIHRAAALVEAAAVTLYTDGSAAVLSHGIRYIVGGFTPHTCKDIEVGGAVDARCKHKYSAALAKALRRKERAMERIRSLRFYASLGNGPTQVHGTAIVWEDGRIFFCEQDKQESIPCSYAEITLGGRIDMINHWRP